MPNHVKLVVDQLSELGKLSDTQRVLRDLENIEKAVLYTRKIVLRRINAPKRKKPMTLIASVDSEAAYRKADQELEAQEKEDCYVSGCECEGNYHNQPEGK